MRAHLLTVAVACVLAAGCKKSAAPPQRGPMGPAEVTVVTLHAEKVALKTELAGRTDRVAVLRGAAAGLRHRQGAHVRGRRARQGRPGALPDRCRRMYRAAVARRRGRPREREGVARGGEARGRALREARRRSRACSKQEADDARAHARSRRSRAWRRSRPRSRPRASTSTTRRSRRRSAAASASRRVTAGALVTANQPQPLATIRALDPIYVDLTESSEERLRLRAQLGAGTLAGRQRRRSS